MIFRYRFFTLALLSIALSAPIALATSYCGGGDGPHPFNEATFKSKIKFLPTQGTAQDLVYFHDREQVHYRNEKNELYRTSAKDGKGDLLFTESLVRISGLADPFERFILGHKVGKVFDASLLKPFWWSFIASQVEPQHLYWHGRFLYSLAASAKCADGSCRRNYRIYRFRPIMGTDVAYCSFREPWAGMKLAEGHDYPYIFFYTARRVAEGWHLEVQLFNAATCRWENFVYDFEHPFLAPIKRVMRFQKFMATAVTVDAPTRNLMWQYNGDCEYFSLEHGEQPVVPSPRHLFMATWTRDQGMTWINLAKKSRAPMLQQLPIVNLPPENIQLSADGRDLILAPVFSEERPQAILRLDVQ